MRSLFVRIFLSYWVAQALIVVLAILVTLAIHPSGEIAGLGDDYLRAIVSFGFAR